VPLALEARRRLAGDDPAPPFVTWIEGIARLVVLPAALFAAASFALSPGRQAALVAAPWIAACGVIGLGGVSRALATWPRAEALRGGGQGGESGKGGTGSASGAWYRFGIWALLGASSLYLPVGSIWLVLSRLGTPVGGFLVPIPALTGVHFHYTTFALPAIAAMTGKCLERAARDRAPAAHVSASPAARAAAWPGRAATLAFGAIATLFVIAPAVLALGWILGLVPLKIVATLLLAAASAGLAALILIVSPRLAPPAARALLRISGASIVVAMVLAALYQIGEVLEPVAISIPRMAQVHGVLNALGFALCGLLGWLFADSKTSFPESGAGAR
jgi:hypothetical protein